MPRAAVRWLAFVLWVGMMVTGQEAAATTVRVTVTVYDKDLESNDESSLRNRIGDAPVRVTNVETGESRSFRTDPEGVVTLELEPGIYRFDGPGGYFNYINPEHPDNLGLLLLGPGEIRWIRWRLPQDSLFSGMTPDDREKLTRDLEKATTPEEKLEAVERRIRRAEEALGNALRLNRSTPGLFNIDVLYRSLRAMAWLRAHYLDMLPPDRRQSAADPAARPESVAAFEAPGWSLTPLVSLERRELAPIGVGTVRLGPGDEVFLNRSPDDTTGVAYGVRLANQIGDMGPIEGVELFGGYAYAEGDASGSGSEPVGGAEVAMTYFAPAPNGSTGVFLGATGASARQRVEWNEHRVFVGASGALPLNDDGSVSLLPSVGLKYERFEQDHRAGIQSLTFAGIDSSIRQRVEEELVGPSFGLHLALRDGHANRIRIGGSLDLLYRSASLDSAQRNSCDLCPPSERSFTARNEDDEDDFTYRIRASVAGDHAIAPSVSLGWEVSVTHTGDRAFVRNPANPLDPAPHLGSFGATDVSAMFRLTVAFGAS